MASSNETVFGVTTGQFIIPPGLTQALYINAAGIPGCISTLLKYNSGGTLQMIGCPIGATLSLVQLAGFTGQAAGYLFGTTEALAIGGAPIFYLAASGATTFVNFVFGKTAGT